jgi:hypothetical protein
MVSNSSSNDPDINKTILPKQKMVEEKALQSFYFSKITADEEHRFIQMIQGGSQSILTVLQSERNKRVQGILDV